MCELEWPRLSREHALQRLLLTFNFIFYFFILVQLEHKYIISNNAVVLASAATKKAAERLVQNVIHPINIDVFGVFFRL